MNCSDIVLPIKHCRKVCYFISFHSSGGNLQTMSHGPTACFQLASGLKMLCSFFHWKIIKIKIRTIFFDIWKLHEIQMPMSITNILCELRHIHLFTCGPWLLSCRVEYLRQNTWATMLKIFTRWPFTKKFADLCSTTWIPTQVNVILTVL